MVRRLKMSWEMQVWEQATRQHTHSGVEADLMIKRAYVKVSTPILNGAQRGDGRSGWSTIPP